MSYCLNKRNCLSEILLISLLSLSLLDWNGFGYYVFYAPLLLFLCKGGFKYIDSTFGLLFFFGCSYSLIDFFYTGTISYVYNVLPVVNFPISYLMGKMLAKHQSQDQQITTLWVFALALALLTLISTYLSIMEDGFSVVGRSIRLIGYSGDGSDTLYSATSLYSKLLPLTLFLGFIFIPTENKSRWIYAIAGGLAFVCCIRLQSRSAIYIMAITLLIPLLLDNGKHKVQKFFSFVLIVGIVIFVLSNYSDELLVIERFQTNSAFDNEGQDSRMDLAIKTLQDILFHPFGGLKTNRYAHNLWIDSARVSGWIPLILLIAISYKWIQNTCRIWKSKMFNTNYRLLILIVSISLFVYYNTEPILEGAHTNFVYFCIFLGMISESLIIFKK